MKVARALLRTKTGRIFSAMVLGIGLAGFAMPAHADSFSIDPSCEHLGGSHWLCDANPSGGTAPYSYTWTADPAIMLNNGTPKHGESVSMICIVGGTLTISASDSAGNSQVLSAQFSSCPQGPGQ